jgi:hypothetical protein
VLLFGHFGGENGLAGAVVRGDDLRHDGCGEDGFWVKDAQCLERLLGILTHCEAHYESRHAVEHIPPPQRS